MRSGSEEFVAGFNEGYITALYLGRVFYGESVWFGFLFRWVRKLVLYSAVLEGH